jgi:hypothetical protein
MQRRNSNFIQTLHTIVGLISLILVLLLVFTGLLLNHRDKLSLHEKYPTNSLVLWLYGFQENGKAEENYVETPPTWERVITAFHGGRFFGKPVYLLVDVIGALILLQAITGLYIWLKKIRSNKET